MKEFSSILDWGCGTGRWIRHLRKVLPEVSIHGCDVLEESVETCRQSIPTCCFSTIPTLPPTNFSDAQFDFIYSYGVFTHLTERAHEAWLEELGRLLAPGGMMLHTIKAYEFLKRANTFSPEAIQKYRLPEPLEEFVRRPARYHFVEVSADTPEYGLTIIDEEYVRSRWPVHSGLRLMDYIEGAIEAYPEGCQDLVVMTKDPAPPCG